MGMDEGRWGALLKGRPAGQGFVRIDAYIMIAVVAPCGVLGRAGWPLRLSAFGVFGAMSSRQPKTA